METIARLGLLSQNDRDRQAARRVLERVPQELEELARRLEQERAVLDAAKAERDALVKRRRGLERENQELCEGRKKAEADLARIKNNEEYRAALRQIEYFSEKVSANEDATLLTFEEEETIAERIARAEAQFERARERLSGRKAELDAELQRSKDELSRLDARRIELVRGLPDDLARRYERVSDARGTAVVALVANSCGGCFTALPPQVINRLRAGADYYVCDGCGRIVIRHDEGPGG
jgi:predicted  nucleic acid-binding Zn-ribbon protein